MVNVGDLFAGEERTVLFRLGVPAVDALGTATIASIVLEYTSLPDLLEHKVTLPICVNVVPGDEARNRVPNPVVQVAELLVDIDAQKKDVAASLRDGDSAKARTTLSSAVTSLNAKRLQVRGLPDQPGLTSQLDEAARELLGLTDDLLHQPAEYSSKSVMNSYAATSRGRKPKPRPNITPTSDTDEGAT